MPRIPRISRSDRDAAPAPAQEPAAAADAETAVHEPVVEPVAPSAAAEQPVAPAAAAEQPVAPPAQPEQPTAIADPVAAPVAEPAPEASPEEGQGSFLDRGRMRRRLRFLRRARELAFRDLGGLVFDLHRFGRQRDDLVGGKIARLEAIDSELRALEHALDDKQDVTVIREPGLAACPRCGALHGSDANFCSACALPVRAEAGLPIGSPGTMPPAAGPHPGQA